MAQALRGQLSSASIIDIRRNELQDTLAADIRRMLRPEDGGEKRLPTLLLYDEIGLKLFEDITYLDEYYLTNAEIEVLKQHAHDIAARIPQKSVIVELGSGNLRKVNIILQALDAAQKEIDYYALDLDRPELERTLAAVPPGTFDHVRCHGLFGTYDDGLTWLKMKSHEMGPRCIMSLGSSIGNFGRDEAADFLGNFANGLSSKDMLIVAVDNCQDPERVYHAYNDKHGVTHQFVLNGLANANRVLGEAAFEPGVWSVIGEYDSAAGRHHAFVTPSRDVTVEGVKIAAGEKIRIEESYKYSQIQAEKLWRDAGLFAGASFGDSTDLNMLTKPDFVFDLEPEKYAATAVPTLNDWQQLWASWDLTSRRLIPEQELLSKPINLRNCCLFYLGHIPGFLDIHLTRSTDGKPTHPAYYHDIFERGIDPDVEDPEKCHAHSEIPDEWPPVEEILQYQEDVRERVKSLYEDGSLDRNPKLRRVLGMTFEHEVMHLETFLYMLMQSEHVVSPPGVQPDFAALADEAALKAVPNEWFKVPATKVQIGRADPQYNYEAGHFFGWDVENPARVVDVHQFEAQGRPLTNGDYARYMITKGINAAPASWTTDSRPDSGYSGSRASPPHAQDEASHIDQETFDSFIRGKAVRTLFGPVPLKYVLDWPVWASYDELAGCASFYGGRIPTLEEARSIYSYAEQQRLINLGNRPHQTIPAVNGHLSNNGVHQTPPPEGAVPGAGSDCLSEQVAEPERKHLFADLTHANVGFSHFHPMPVTGNGNRLAGLGEMGGVWEWTSSPLSRHEGFEPMELYPAYSTDFFDGKHNVVLGGSWATHPRIAGRKTFVNWYQRNYPYVWAGARLVRDV